MIRAPTPGDVVEYVGTMDLVVTAPSFRARIEAVRGMIVDLAFEVPGAFGPPRTVRRDAVAYGTGFRVYDCWRWPTEDE